jgi:small subunit ribosomal protein S3
MCRNETYKLGKVPLQTLRADIDYGAAESLTTYGLIGVKVWIYKGDILGRPQYDLPRPMKSESQHQKQEGQHQRPVKEQPKVKEG